MNKTENLEPTRKNRISFKEISNDKYYIFITPLMIAIPDIAFITIPWCRLYGRNPYYVSLVVFFEIILVTIGGPLIFALLLELVYNRKKKEKITFNVRLINFILFIIKELHMWTFIIVLLVLIISFIIHSVSIFLSYFGRLRF